MKTRSKTLLLALCCALLLSSVVYAATRTKTLTAYYNDIQLVVDGVPVTPKDANGTVVEPFIVDGTTYLPVRAVGEAMGKTVDWDGRTHTVYVGNVPGEDIYLMDVCPPYATRNYAEWESFHMMGKRVFHGFALTADGGYAYFNLNAEYETLEFDFGHVDGTDMYGAEFTIYLDGEYVQTISGTPDMMMEHITIPLDYGLQLKIVCTAGYGQIYRTYYGFGNLTLS